MRFYSYFEGSLLLEHSLRAATMPYYFTNLSSRKYKGLSYNRFSLIYVGMVILDSTADLTHTVDGGREQAVRQHARRRTRTTHGKYAAVAAARPVAGIPAIRSAYNAGATVLRPAVRRWVRRRVRRYAVAAASAAESGDRCRDKSIAGRPCSAS